MSTTRPRVSEDIRADRSLIRSAPAKAPPATISGAERKRELERITAHFLASQPPPNPRDFDTQPAPLPSALNTNALIALAEEIGAALGAETQQRKVEVAELRADVARLQADIASLRAVPLADFERMISRFEERLIEAIGRALSARQAKSGPTVN